MQVYVSEAGEVVAWVLDPGRERYVAGDEVDAEDVFAEEDCQAFVSRLVVCGEEGGGEAEAVVAAGGFSGGGLLLDSRGGLQGEEEDHVADFGGEV